MNRTRTTLATVVVTAVVAGVGAVIAHATVPGRNGQIVFRKALGNPARLAIVNADGTGYRMLPRAKGVDDGQSGLVTRRREDRVPSVPTEEWAGAARSSRCVQRGTGLTRLGTRTAPADHLRVRIASRRRGLRTAQAIAFSRAWGAVVRRLDQVQRDLCDERER